MSKVKSFVKTQTMAEIRQFDNGLIWKFENGEGLKKSRL